MIREYEAIHRGMIYTNLESGLVRIPPVQFSAMTFVDSTCTGFIDEKILYYIIRLGSVV